LFLFFGSAVEQPCSQINVFGAREFFWLGAKTNFGGMQNNNKKKMSSDMRSVPDPKSTIVGLKAAGQNANGRELYIYNSYISK